MNFCLRVAILFLTCAGPLFLYAEEPIKGKVLNQTTGHPAAGDQVMLLGEGIKEEARTTTDSEGSFVLPATSNQSHYVIRVLHQGVAYDQAVRNPAQLQIRLFDAVAKIPGLKGKMGIAQVGSDGKTVTVREMYSVTNASTPPVTQASSHNFEITLPGQAILDSVELRGPSDPSFEKFPASPVQGHNGQYTVDFPIRPGDTLFKFAYHMPYQDAVTLHVRVPYPIEKFAVAHPASLSFKSSKPSGFMNAGIVNGLAIEQATAKLVTGELPAFQISGVGVTEPGTPAVSAAPAPVAHQTRETPKPVSPPAAPSRQEIWIMLPGITIMAMLIVGMVLRTRRRARAAQGQQ
ncbi:MAG: hypothetical protein DMG65_16610 [Candidatus Angelobacter sp. Gp1-AA117]|nr:MAG: hypothetical protein DMG65_16610 [Candidatus Angelobacter sp. Gp1-AA117]